MGRRACEGGRLSLLVRLLVPPPAHHPSRLPSTRRPAAGGRRRLTYRFRLGWGWRHGRHPMRRGRHVRRPRRGGWLGGGGRRCWSRLAGGGWGGTGTSEAGVGSGDGERLEEAGWVAGGRRRGWSRLGGGACRRAWCCREHVGRAARALFAARGRFPHVKTSLLPRPSRARSSDVVQVKPGHAYGTAVGRERGEGVVKVLFMMARPWVRRRP